MLIEQSAYANRWRAVSPAAKGGFALGGLLAAFVANTPTAAAGIALVVVATTLLGARVSPWLYLRVAAPATAFLAVSSLSLMFSISLDASGGPQWQFAPDAVSRIATVASRSLASLAALLFLVLTTPLRDLHSLGLLAANLVVQVWQRAQALATAALARNGCGSLRFLSPAFAHARRDTLIAAAASLALIALAGSLDR